MQAIALIARGMWGSAGGARLGWPCAAALVRVSRSAPAGTRDLWGEDIPRDAPVRIWLGHKEIKVLCGHGGAGSKWWRAGPVSPSLDELRFHQDTLQFKFLFIF